MKKRWFFILFFLILICPSFAQDEDFILEPIVVTSGRNSYCAEVLTAEDLRNKGIITIADIFEYAGGVDLRYRGQFNVQGDLSLRGSTYEQVAVLINGIRINDPQTGHHNLDIPLTVFDIDKVEVFKEGLSSRFGSGAFAGAVNIVTKKPSRRILNTELLFGAHALSGQAISFSMPGNDWSSRVSFEHKISNGGRPNTDFEYKTASVYLDKDYDAASFNAVFGYQKKNFGADSFYSNLFPEEQEHTETLFFKGGVEAQSVFGSPRCSMFLRKHRDKFILNRNNPAFVNYHTTNIYGINSNADFAIGAGTFLPGFDIAREEINSTRLGKHRRLNMAPSFVFIPQLGECLSADVRLRFDHYSGLGWQESYNAAIGWRINQQFTLKGSYGQAFRIPSFTELYYFDPGNIGNADLGVEQSDNFKAGFTYEDKFLDCSLEGFYRRGRNLIDWARNSAAEPWQATNLGRADFRGVDFQLKIRVDNPLLPRPGFSYTYIDVDKGRGEFFSKYALDILKHQFILGLDYNLLGLNFSSRSSYNDRCYGKGYFLTGIYLSKKISCRHYSLEPFFKVDNLTNAKYTEVGDVLQPGRWIQAGLRFEW